MKGVGITSQIYLYTRLLQWYEKFTNVDEVIPVSAKYGHGVDDVKEWILSKLPCGPAYYSKVLLLSLLSMVFSYSFPLEIEHY